MALLTRRVLTAGVLTIAPNFHHMRLLGILTVLTAIFAALFGRAIASGMCAFLLVLSHKNYPAFCAVLLDKS